MNKSSCSLQNFFDEAIDGANDTELPRWGGTNETSNALSGTVDTIQLIKDDYANSFSIVYNSHYEVDIGIRSVEQNFNSIMNRISTHSFPYDASYFSNFEDNSDNSTLLGKIHYDFTKSVKKAYSYFSEIKIPLNEIATNHDLLKSILEGFITEFTGIEGLIGDASSTLTTNFVNIQEILSGPVSIVIKIFLSIIIVFSGTIIISLSIYVWLKIYCLKKLINVLWHISFVLILLNIIIGGLLGILGKIGNNMGPVIGYLMTPEYINSEGSLFGGSGNDAGNYINVCLNGNGDLTSSMGALSQYTKSLSQLYSISQRFNREVKESMKDITGTGLTKESITYLSYYLNHYEEITTNKGVSIPSIIIQLNHYSGDYFCILNNKFYKSCLTTKQEILNCDAFTGNQTLHDYCLFIFGVIKDLPTLEREFNVLTNLLVGTIDKTNKLSDEVEQFTSSLNNSLFSILGEEGDFYDLFNCSYIKKNLIMFCDQFSSRFPSAVNSISIGCIIGSIFYYISLYFIPPTVTRYSEEARVNEKNSKTVDLETFSLKDQDNQDVNSRSQQEHIGEDSKISI